MKEAASIGGLFFKKSYGCPRTGILPVMNRDLPSSNRFKSNADLIVGSPLRPATGGDAVEHQVKMLRQSDGLSMM